MVSWPIYLNSSFHNEHDHLTFLFVTLSPLCQWCHNGPSSLFGIIWKKSISFFPSRTIDAWSPYRPCRHSAYAQICFWKLELAVIRWIWWCKGSWIHNLCLRPNIVLEKLGQVSAFLVEVQSRRELYATTRMPWFTWLGENTAAVTDEREGQLLSRKMTRAPGVELTIFPSLVTWQAGVSFTTRLGSWVSHSFTHSFLLLNTVYRTSHRSARNDPLCCIISTVHPMSTETWHAEGTCFAVWSILSCMTYFLIF